MLPKRETNYLHAVKGQNILATSQHRLRVSLIVLLISLFFAATYGLLPHIGFTYHQEGLRQVFSIAIFLLCLVGFMVSPSIAFPVFMGILPLLLTLQTVGALYGRGLEILMLCIVVIVLLRMPKQKANGIKLLGLLFIVVFLIETFLWLIYDSTLLQNYGVLVNYLTFVLMIYFVHKVISFPVFIQSLYAIIAGNLIILVWLIVSTPPELLLITRLGQGLALNPNTVALFGFSIVVALTYLASLRRRRLNVYQGALFLFSCIAIFLSGGRTVWAALALFLFVHYLFIKHKRLTAILAVALVMLVFIFPVARVSTILPDQLTSSYQYSRLSINTETARDKLNVFSWHLARENPLFGVGPENYSTYLAQAGVFGPGVELNPHNTIAGTASEYGFIGLALFILWMSAFALSHRNNQKYSWHIITITLCVLLNGLGHGLFFQFYYSTYFLMAVLTEKYRPQWEGSWTR